jgi:zinc protease
MLKAGKINNALLMILWVCFFFPLSSYGDCLSTVWPHDKSDLSPDSSVIYGRLDNGFRYVLKKNGEPENRVAMSLDIQAGSLHEDDDQRGIAHFLEHMLFNGSTHFPPGELVEYFQSIGMSFGGDTNAHTGFDETVYDIILPEGKKEDIEKGLLVFADYARGALLLQSEIDRERGVILAEKRARDSAAYRAHIKELKFSMRGTRVPERIIIGTLETLNKADHTILKRYYDAWYRPDNMVLVMVGDFEPAMVQPLIEKQFGPLRAAGKASACPDLGRMLETEQTQFFYHQESEMGFTETGIESHWNVEPQNDSIALQTEELRKYLGSKIVQHRLDELSKKSDTPFTSAKIYSGVFLDRFGYGEISTKSEPDKWQQSLTLMENTLRQALQHGFTEEEVQRVKNELLSDLETAVLTQKSRNSKRLTSSIIRSLNENRVFLSPEQERKLYTPLIKNMSVADLEKTFRAIWSHKSRIVKVNGRSVISGDEPLKGIASIYEAASGIQVQPYKDTATIKFPYLQLEGVSGKAVASEESFSDISSRRIVFANGVVVNLKKTDFQENEIQIAADFGLGKSGAPVPGLPLLADAVIDQSGTGRLSAEELDKIMSGTSVDLTFRVGQSAFQWKVKSLNKDVELSFQVLQSLLADPGVDPEAYKVSMVRLKQHYDAMTVDVRGAMQLAGNRFLASGNPFVGIPPWSEFSQLGIGQLEKWYIPAAKNGALEISLVGDFDEKEILYLAEKYFSVLPDRKAKEGNKKTLLFPAGKNKELQVPSVIDKAMLVVAWKTDDFWNIQRTRSLHLLAEVFTDKLRKEVREKLGATYSPQVYNASSRIYDGYGVIQAVLIIDPAQIEMLEKVVLNIADELYQGNISEKELENAKGPMLTSLKDMVRTNPYWLSSVLGLSSRYPQQLQWPLTILSGFSGFTVNDIRALGKQYLQSGSAAVVTVVPAK